MTEREIIACILLVTALIVIIVNSLHEYIKRKCEDKKRVTKRCDCVDMSGLRKKESN